MNENSSQEPQGRAGVSPAGAAGFMVGEPLGEPGAAPQPSPSEAVTEVLLLPDGRVFAHNLTPTFTALLAELNPADPQFAPRVVTPATSAPGDKQEPNP